LTLLVGWQEGHPADRGVYPYLPMAQLSHYQFFEAGGIFFSIKNFVLKNG